MCEKNFVDGKVMSLSSKEENDDTIPSDWESVKKSKKKKRSKPKEQICDECGDSIVENKEEDSLHKKNKYHVMLAKEYCEEDELRYSNHKCEVEWCGSCGYLKKYWITLVNKTGRDEIQKGK